MRPVDTVNNRAAMFILCSSWIPINQYLVPARVNKWVSNLEEKFGSVRNVELRNRGLVFAGAALERLFFLRWGQ